MEVSFFNAFVGGLISVMSPTGLATAVAIVVFVAALTCVKNANRVDNSPGRPGILKYTVVFLLFYTTIFVILGANASLLTQLPGFRPVAKWIFYSKEAFVLIAGLALFLISLVSYLKGKAIGFFGSNWFAMAFAVIGGVFAAIAWIPEIGPMLGSILFEAQQGGGASSTLFLYSIGRAAAFMVLPIIAGWLMILLSGRQGPTAWCGVFAGAALTAIGFILSVLAV